MSDLVSIQPARPPWQPTADAQIVATYHFYDRPLIGVISQAGVMFLFRCVAGELTDWNLWSYTLLERDERSTLETASEFREALDLVTEDKPSVVALARDGVGIVSSELAEHPDEIPLVGAQLVDEAKYNYPGDTAIDNLVSLRLASTMRVWMQMSTSTSIIREGRETVWQIVPEESDERVS